MSAPPTEDRFIAPALRVPFRDVDMHGHVHNAAYLSYAEAAINDFLRSNALGSHFSPRESGVVYFVRKAELLFDKPSFFEDELFFEVSIARLGSASIGFAVHVYGADETAPRVTASVVWVCVDAVQKRATGIPEETMAALARLPASARPDDGEQ